MAFPAGLRHRVPRRMRLPFPKGRRLRAPTVSSQPPPARREPVIGGPFTPTAILGDAESFPYGRAYAFVGPKGSGKSTIARIIADASELGIRVFSDLEEAGEAIDRMRALTTKEGEDGAGGVVIVDALRSVEDVQRLYNLRLVAPGWGGAVVRVMRNAVVDRAFDSALASIEARILDLSLPYFVLRNDDLEQSVIEFCRRAGVVR